MRNSYKIIIIVALFILTVFIVLLISRPVLLRGGLNLIKIEEEKKKNAALDGEIGQYLEARDEYYLLNAEQQKLAMELPEESDISILTNDLYEVAKYTDIEIQSINFDEVPIDEDNLKKEPVKEIEIEIILTGSYYQILNYINTIEIMPRIIKIEDILIETNEDDYEYLAAFLKARTYFTNEYYKKTP